MLIRILGTGLLALSLGGCATVVRGTTEDVVINYSPADAKVVTSLGHACAQSPCTVNVERKREFSVTATKDGYDPETVQVGTKVSGKGAAGMAGNVIVGGVIGVGVDAATGAARDHFPNPVNINLLPVGTKATEPAKKVPAPTKKPGNKEVPTS